MSEELHFKTQNIKELVELQPLQCVLVSTKELDDAWNEAIRKWHYLGYKKMIGQRIKYLIYSENMLLSAISFNRSSLRVGVRDEWLGWDETTRRRLSHHVVNNNRFLIMPWIRIKNLASHILSIVLKCLVEDWQRIYGVTPYAVETFVDISRYSGISYKAANWHYLGQTRGFGKVGKAFVYHGEPKGVYIYLLSPNLLKEIGRSCPQHSLSNPKHVRLWQMILSRPDWHSELFEEVGLNEDTVLEIGDYFITFLDHFEDSFSRQAQKRNAEVYIKGLLSDLERKSIEPIALEYLDPKGVRTLQQFLVDSPWDDTTMKHLYQERALSGIADEDAMLTMDGSDNPKKGKDSAGVARQYCGRLGKVDNCQAGVFIGYSSKKGYGLLDSALYLPEKWFEGEYREKWEKCDIPEDTIFRTKTELTLEMINNLDEQHGLPFKWAGGDAAFGSHDFRKKLPSHLYFFGDVRSDQLIFLTKPEWQLPDSSGNKGSNTSKLIPTVEPIQVKNVALDESIPWQTVSLGEGSKGTVWAQVKVLRVHKHFDSEDDGEAWLYIRKHANGEVRYAIVDAPADIEIAELHRAAILRWPIEQSFQECKSYLGMADYETRSYLGWHRHMLLVMVAFQFVLEIRRMFEKKTNQEKANRF